MDLRSPTRWREAQRLGYAEPDPTADIEGYDAASKTAIIASIAFGARVVAGDVYREGIANISADDIAAAHELGYVVKLLGVAEEVDGRVGVHVHPAMVPVDHPLASVRGSYNAVFIEGEAVGQLMFLGRGAGGGPTASALLGDLIDAAKNLRSGSRGATIGTLHTVRDPTDRRDGIAVLPLARRRRPARRARRDRGCVRYARGVDPVHAAEGPRRRGALDLRDPPRPRVRDGRDDP